MEDEILLETETMMEDSISNLEQRFTKVRTGRANPSLLDGIMVEYYGAPTPLRQLANVTVPEARQLCIKPFDRSCLGNIEKAIFEANIGLTPNNNGEVIILNIGDDAEEKDILILDFLSTIFSSTMSANDKKNKLASKFGLAMTKDLESEVKRMCNLSDGIYNKGINIGIDKGIKLEKNNGIITLIHRLQKHNIPDSDILNSIIEDYHLTRDEALTYMQA